MVTTKYLKALLTSVPGNKMTPGSTCCSSVNCYICVGGTLISQMASILTKPSSRFSMSLPKTLFNLGEQQTLTTYLHTVLSCNDDYRPFEMPVLPGYCTVLLTMNTS